jgi:hypothetical protein
MDTPPTPELDWMAPDALPSPQDALPRIRVLCGRAPDLFSALFVVAATHPGGPRPILAEAVRQCRPEAAELSADDVAVLLTALHTGAREAVEALLRRRSGRQRAASAMSWVKD